MMVIIDTEKVCSYLTTSYVTFYAEHLLFFAKIGDWEGNHEQHTEKDRRYINWCWSHECDFGSDAERVSS